MATAIVTDLGVDALPGGIFTFSPKEAAPVDLSPCINFRTSIKPKDFRTNIKPPIFRWRCKE